MDKIVGQTKLLDQLSVYSLDTFPNTILLTGERGSGKHLIANYIANKFNLPLVDITDILSHDVIDNIYRNPNLSFYMIDLDKSHNLNDERNQNVMLKFIEEPSSNVFVILLSENKYNLLDTIINRCVNFEMNKYSDSELSNFSSDNELIKVIRTPGKLKLCNENISNIRSLCDKMLSDMSKANFANALTIADRFNYADDYDKIDIEIFLDLFLELAYQKYKESNNKNIINMYLLVSNEKKKLRDKRINKKIFMQHLIIKIWKEARNG